MLLFIFHWKKSFFSRHPVVGIFVGFNKKKLKSVEKRQLWVQSFEWLKLNVVSCVVHQTRSYDMVFVSVFFSASIKTLWKTKKRQLWGRPMEWLKLNFVICVVHETRAFKVIILYSGGLPVVPVCARQGHRHYSEAPALLWKVPRQVQVRALNPSVVPVLAPSVRTVQRLRFAGLTYTPNGRGLVFSRALICHVRFGIAEQNPIVYK